LHSFNIPGHSVGIPSAALVPDHRFTATSYYSQFYKPYIGRLGLTPAWVSKTNIAKDYLQIDLGSTYYACAIATQGNQRKGVKEWVTSYRQYIIFSGQ
jgi:hypothetical protein